MFTVVRLFGVFYGAYFACGLLAHFVFPILSYIVIFIHLPSLPPALLHYSHTVSIGLRIHIVLYSILIVAKRKYNTTQFKEHTFRGAGLTLRK